MEEHELLMRHAAGWASEKKRGIDEEILREVLSLRDRYDDLPYGAWPRGSAERLLLTTWPAYGDQLPDLEALRETLDTFWSFLRATGRMTAKSASPGELRKEAKRAVPKMQSAYDDPSRHSTGRVLTEFGAGIGISLEDAESTEDLQQRLNEIQDAWNALPQSERTRLMPDPMPKSARGASFTSAIQNAEGELEQESAELPEFAPSDPKESAKDARASRFVQQCLALAEWVGDGKEATQRGLLRPAVAREAYQHLALWPWERAHDNLLYARFDRDPVVPGTEADSILARTALEGWRSAGDCLPLDRLWFSLESADLVEHIGARVRQSTISMDTDEAFLGRSLALLAGLCQRLGDYRCEPLAGLLSLPHLHDGRVALDVVRDWWQDQCPEQLRNLSAFGWSERLDDVLFHFADCNLWQIQDDQISLTALGNDFMLTYLHMLDEGLLGD